MLQCNVICSVLAAMTFSEIIFKQLKVILKQDVSMLLLYIRIHEQNI